MNMHKLGQLLSRPSGRRGSPLWGGITSTLGIVSIISPFVAGTWTLAVLGLAVLAAAAVGLSRTLRTRTTTEAGARYLQVVVMILVGLLLFFRPGQALSGLLFLIAVLFFVGGVSRIVSAIRQGGQERPWEIFNGIVQVLLGLLIWRQRQALGVVAIGLLVGAWLISAGWAMLFAKSDETSETAQSFRPDRLLGLPPHPELDQLSQTIMAQEKDRRPIDLLWCLTLILIFFAIHIGRMDLGWNWFGIVSTAVAVLGDMLTALLLTVLLLFPARLLWRKITWPVERSAWQRRLRHGEAGSSLSLGDRLINGWLDMRLRFAVHLQEVRGSFTTALWRGMQAGLPLTAMLVAINPIWGFTWYFNTENWVSGFWQKLTETRVDLWRTRMIEAVVAKEGAATVRTPGLFEVQPDGVAGVSDFSFLVIGDPGEGDPSQQSLRDRYLLEGRREDVRFLVVASDVIYPAGAMKDYEFNFYLPFKGFEKPIYAIPGNHDWFGALDAFNANFLEADAARVAIRARLEADLPLTRSAEARIQRLMTQATQLRREYNVQTGLQRAPFFEIHSESFAFIAGDTGILRRFDDRQRAWFEAALERAQGKFTMVLLGHPLFAGGQAQGPGDPPFGELHDLLRKYEIPLVMAGDTHDFEYYREVYGAAGATKVMHHFVNGGGGAYLSIGTALDWPTQPPVADWAFYPSTAAVKAKLDAETPAWKRPLWWWVRSFNAWPASPEMLSGVFDFNHAPFFQSFMEVRVEGSARRVRLLLYGVHGLLRWRDLQSGGQVVPGGRGPEDPVEFVIPMTGGSKNPQ